MESEQQTSGSFANCGPSADEGAVRELGGIPSEAAETGAPRETLSRNLFDDGERKTLTELRAARLPRCTPEAIGATFTVNDSCPPERRAEAEADQRELTEALAKYLAAFLPPGPCVKCGAVLGGSEKNLLGAMFGTFEWGLAHGEGRCGRCGYPARGIHRIDLGKGEEASFSAILQYHPDDLTERAP